MKINFSSKQGSKQVRMPARKIASKERSKHAS